MGITATQTRPQTGGDIQATPGRIGILLAGLTMAAVFTLLLICAAIIMCLSTLRILLEDVVSALARHHSHIRRENDT